MEWMNGKLTYSMTKNVHTMAQCHVQSMSQLADYALGSEFSGPPALLGTPSTRHRIAFARWCLRAICISRLQVTPANLALSMAMLRSHRYCVVWTFDPLSSIYAIPPLLRCDAFAFQPAFSKHFWIAVSVLRTFFKPSIQRKTHTHTRTKERTKENKNIYFRWNRNEWWWWCCTCNLVIKLNLNFRFEIKGKRFHKIAKLSFSSWCRRIVQQEKMNLLRCVRLTVQHNQYVVI